MRISRLGRSSRNEGRSQDDPSLNTFLRVSRALMLTCCAPGLIGCATGRIAHTLGPLPACGAERVATPPEWGRRELGNGFSIALPSSCGPEQDVAEAVHGGSRWQCGSVGVSVYWGMWGADPTDVQRPCKTRCGGLRVVVMRASGTGAQEGVWYLTGHVHEPIVDASSDEVSDWATVLAITRSGELNGPPGPNR